MIIGGAFAQLRDRVNAETHLKKAIEGSKEMQEEYLRAGAHAHRAFHYLGGGQLTEALEDIREFLRCMRENGYVHFFSWTPQVVQPLLETAVKNGIEVKYARKLSRERLGLAILTDGTTIPLLKINTLGGLSIAIENGVVLKVEELTQTQRELLALLIASPGLKMCQEKIQVVLWPESAPEKSRANFDNLLMRLRKTLGKAINPHSVKYYLSLKKGILCLENCLLDVGEFVKKARKGLKHARSKELWQAGNAFYSAHNLWKGHFLPNVPGSEAVQCYRDDLERFFIESSCRWAKILLLAGRTAEADRVLGEAVKHDPANDELARCLYALHIERGRPAQALLALKAYKAALQRADYSPKEIKQILSAVTNPAS
jgi:DNA-binding SARP family transcriptional activator